MLKNLFLRNITKKFDIEVVGKIRSILDEKENWASAPRIDLSKVFSLNVAYFI
jgi:hypothetical protein